jgi:Na+/H+ antiporter NhaB
MGAMPQLWKINRPWTIALSIATGVLVIGLLTALIYTKLRSFTRGGSIPQMTRH